VASVTHTKYAETTISVFAPAWMLQVNGVGDTHGSTPATVYVACWTTTLPTAATRRTSQLSCRDALIGLQAGEPTRGEPERDPRRA
jgi:hypothetical protein